MTVKYIGPARDYSGYGEATRHDIAALGEAGVDVSTKIPRYTPEIADFGSVGERVEATENRALVYDTIILHTTPNVYQQYMEPGKYHIARVFWETDKLPMDFAANVQACDEVWTGSEYNKQAIQAAGITKPIFVIPEAVDTEIDLLKHPPYKIAPFDTYKFYSLFEWTERKNPNALIEAYFQEFTKGEKVSLTIKTYVDNFSRAKRDEINDAIAIIKTRIKLDKYPELYLYRELMDRNQVYKFHNSFDCFVSAHRGEGWGIPQMEAMIMNKPVISTNCGGIHEYLKDGVDALLIPFTLIPLKTNSRNQHWYTNDQKWANVDIVELRKAMRACYEHQEEAVKMGISGGKRVRELFSLPVVGKQMAERLGQIESERRAKIQIV